MDARDLARVMDGWTGVVPALVPILAPVSEDADVRRAREAVAQVGRQLWSITTEADLEERLSSLIERGPWPSMVPLLNCLAMELPAGERTLQGLWPRIEGRVREVFGPDLVVPFRKCVGVFGDAYRVERLTLEKQAKQASLSPAAPSWGAQPPMALLFRDDFPPTMRRVILGNFRAILCSMALLDALIRHTPEGAWKARSFMDECIRGRGDYIVLAVGLLEDNLETLRLLSTGVRPPTFEELVEEGVQARLARERLLSGEDDLDEVEASVRRQLIARGLDPDETIQHAARALAPGGDTSS